MKINNKILSIPPYLSTSWSNITAIQMSTDHLIVHLLDGKTIDIPGLDKEIVDQVFAAHANSLMEKNTQNKHSIGVPFPAFQEFEGSNNPFRIGFNALDGLGTAMQHNQEQANMPNLPDEMLEKIKAISKIVSPNEIAMIPKPEPHCNCVHCQIARAINEGTGNLVQEEQSLEQITEEDLQFRQWDIVQKADKMFTVVNPLDNKETYNVFLGNPIGCTCGEEGCEHILAVLKS